MSKYRSKPSIIPATVEPDYDAAYLWSFLMQYRDVGQTGLNVSIFGFGGVVVMNSPQEEADREVAAAIDQGVTYFDVAPQYGDAQQRMGPALEPYRNNVTLACKTLMRTAAEARAELEDSLTKLRTDHFDIYQLHSMTTQEDVDTALGSGGALETLLAARDEGKVRHIGFSAHNEEAALQLIATGHFETMLVPLNYVIFEFGNFGPRMLDAANQRGMGVLALKAMARAKIKEGEPKPFEKCWYLPEDRPEIAELLLRYTFDLPGVAAAIPPGNPDLCSMALSFADAIGPLDDASRATLAEACAGADPLFTSA